ncbi:uncharacterized protein LOC129589185 [Paramacrobiotus metropolitanus]|uniref:uncharacterized protein LOC129589185 n=1 Tax=Paramacrobiotus metropolitanus TaxID=2943436 RepID=UPI0024461986|nr:uncharacterized protein LOC129589185 [Paramacrobiotus metropolitanus]
MWRVRAFSILCVLLVEAVKDIRAYKGSFAVESSTFSVSCADSGQVLHIIEAVYGNGCNCSCDWHYTALVVRAKCQGQKSCRFSVDRDVLGDPECNTDSTSSFSRTPKKLLVTYDCVPERNSP